MPLPGCPMREIVRQTDQPGGVFLRLSCGHEQWAAHPVTFQVIGGIGYRPCLEGPCYKFQKPMGDQC
jgi:hypothetical protein